MLVVHRCGGLIKQKHVGLGQGQPGEGHQLTLPSGEAFASFHDGPLQPFGVIGHQTAHACALHHLLQNVIARVGEPDEKVFTQGSLKQAMVLLQVTHLATQHFTADMGDIQAIDQDAALLRMVKTTQQPEQRGLARTDRPKDADAFARRNRQLGHRHCRWIGGQRVVRAVSELNIVQAVLTTNVGGNQWAIHALMVRLEQVQFFQPVHGRLGMGMLHHQARQGQDGRQNAATENGTGDQGAHGHVALHHSDGPGDHQASIAQLLHRGGHVTYAFRGATHAQIVLNGLGIDVDPAG